MISKTKTISFIIIILWSVLIMFLADFIGYKYLQVTFLSQWGWSQDNTYWLFIGYSILYFSPFIFSKKTRKKWRIFLIIFLISMFAFMFMLSFKFDNIPWCSEGYNHPCAL